MFTELSLFSGYGGFSLGLRLALPDVRTVGYVEIDSYCQKIIQARIKDGVLDDAPIFGDICSFRGYEYTGLVSLISAGFPCQPHSVAGPRRGNADERNLWPETLRVIREVGPRWVLLENVPGILGNGYGGTVVGQLSEIGYDCVWDCISAAEAGAPHRRKRWWCLAYPNGLHLRLQPGREWGPSGEEAVLTPDVGKDGNMAESTSGNWWATEPGVCRVADGVAKRMDRLKALGNGIVPAVVRRFLTD